MLLGGSEPGHQRVVVGGGSSVADGDVWTFTVTGLERWWWMIVP